MDARINRVLEKIRANLAESSVKGEPKPDNGTPNSPPPNPYSRSIQDQFFDVMDECVDSLRLSFGLSEKQAFEAVAHVGDLCEAKGHMPPFPTDDMNDAEVARWVNAASYTDFKKKVIEYMTMERSGK